MIGTLDFVAPEIYRMEGSKESYKSPCDIWAAGLICYNLLAGFNPMTKKSPKQMKKEALKEMNIEEKFFT